MLQVACEGYTRGMSFFFHCKHLFCTKNINSAKNGQTKLWFSDESSLFTVLHKECFPSKTNACNGFRIVTNLELIPFISYGLFGIETK